MILNQKNIIHNEFLIEVVDVKTNEVKKEYRAYNVILNKLFSRFTSFNSFFSHIHYGTGTGELSKARTTLFTFLGSKSASLVGGNGNVHSNSVWAKRMIQIMPEEHIGVTITEIGVGHSNNSTDLCTHAFILDSQGNPVGIEKSATDVINIYATVYMTFETSHPNITISSSLAGNTANPFINFLQTQNAPTYPQFQLGNGRFLAEQGAPSIGNSFVTTAASAISWKREATGNVLSLSNRFDINNGNGDIYEIGVSNFLRARFPIPGVWEGYHFKDKPLGVGDGVNKEFIISSVRDPRAGSIVVKSNDVIKNTGYIEEAYFDGVPLPSAIFRSIDRDITCVSGFKDRSFIFYSTESTSAFLEFGKNEEEIVFIHGRGKLATMRNCDFSNDGRFIAATCGANADTYICHLYKASDLENLHYEIISSEVGFGVPEEGGIQVFSGVGLGVKFSRDDRFLLLSYTQKIGNITNYTQAFKYNEVLDTYEKCNVDFDGFSLNTPLLSIGATIDNRYFVATTSDIKLGNNLIVFEIQENGIKVVEKNALFDSVPSNDSLIPAVKISDDGTLLVLMSEKDKSAYIYKLVEGRYELETKHSLSNISMGYSTLKDNKMDISPDNSIFCFSYYSQLYTLMRMKDGSFKSSRPTNPNGSNFAGESSRFNRTSKALYLPYSYNSSSSNHIQIYGYSLKENQTKIIFENPPAEGEVLTFECDVDYIPKDTNSVLDLKVTVQLSDANEAS